MATMTAVGATAQDAPARERWPASGGGSSGLLARVSPGHVLVLVAALVAAVANFALLRAAEDTAPVLVAERPLAAGDAVSDEAITVAEVGATGPVPEALLGPEDHALLEGTVLASPIAEGEPLRHSDLRGTAAPDGLRAMSVPLDRVHAVSGDLQAGDRVDVIATEDAAGFLAHDVEVLAVPAEETGAMGAAGFAVTLAVDAETSLQLAEALHGASLDLVRATGAAPMAEGAAP